MKKSIRHLLLVLAAVLSFTIISKAQPPSGEVPMGPPPEMSSNSVTNEEAEISRIQVDWMKKKLKLNKDQQQAAEKITSVHVGKILALKKKEGYNGSTDPVKQQADHERDEAMKKILTEKQFNRFNKNKHVLENSFENIRAGGMPPPPGM